MKTRITIFPIVLVAVALLAACSNASSQNGGSDSSETAVADFETVKDGCITVAFIEGAMPRISLDGEGGVTGYEGNLVTEFAEKYGLDVCPYPTDFAGTVFSVSTGQADIATSLYYTEERANEVYYSDTIVNDALAFVFPANIDYKSPEDLRDLSWGMVESWTYTPPLQDFYGAENVVMAPGSSEIIQMLRNGQVDASLLGSVGPALNIISESDDFKIVLLEEGDLGIPETMRVSGVHNLFGCQNVAMADAYNDLLAEKIESGEWAAEIASWGMEDPAVIPAPRTTPKQGCGQ